MSTFKELYDADQADQQKREYFLSLNPSARSVERFDLTFAKRCKRRLERVQELVRLKEFTEPADFCFAAMVYHHSLDIEDIAIAHLLAWQSYQLGYRYEEGLVDPLRLAAAARDRFQVSLGLPQDFGTQWDQNLDGSLGNQCAVNPDFTDKERDEWNVGPLNEGSVDEN